MPSKAHEKFSKTIKRCKTLINSYETLHKLNSKNSEIPAPKDIVRGAVILAVSALDAYVTDVFSEKLVPYLKRYKADDSLINLLANAGLDTKEALILISMDRPYRRIRTLIQKYYNTYTTQRFKVIDQIFVPYRLKNLSDNAAKKAGRKNIKRSVEKLIERRHQIAHAGDYNSHGKICNIDEEEIEKRVNDLNLIVDKMDEIICNKI